MADTYITHTINPAVSGGNYNLVTNIKYQSYPTSSLGVIILDENLDLSKSRKLINLYTLKSAWSKFKEIVDTNVTELLPNKPNPPLPYMVAGLQSTKAVAQAQAVPAMAMTIASASS